MHDPILESKALEYVRGLPKREGLADRFSRAEMARHLVGFAESVRRPLDEVWAVVFSNYEPEETDSIWTTKDAAQRRADELNEQCDWSPWNVVKWEVRR